MNMSDQDPVGQSSSDTKRGKKWKWLAFLLSCGIFLAGLCYVWRLMQSPAPGTITQGEVKYDLANPDLPPEIRRVEGKHFSVAIPDTYLEKRHEAPDGVETNVLEQVFLTEESLDSRKLAIVVEKRPPNGIHELSSFALRRLDPKTYEQKSHDLDRKTITIFIKDSVVYEITGYIEKENIVASISLSSAIRTPERLIGDFSDIVGSFRWGEERSQ